jgi:putative DNA primase/helicase
LQFRLTFLKDREPEAPHERRADPNLGEDLKREASGILAWLVRGCLEWQRVGLATPRVVWELTKSYRAEEDFVSEWIEERCSTDDPTAVTKSSILYSDFASWHQENMGTKAPSAVVFSATLRTRFERAKDKKNSRVFKGISLLFNDEEPGYPS